MTAAEMVTAALRWLGYIEKKSPSQLDSRTDNVGSGNFQRFQPLCGAGNGDQWCQYYVGGVAVEATGSIAEAQHLLRMPQSDKMTGYTPEAKSYYVDAGAWYNTPEMGDQVYYYVASKGRVGHTGLVISVDPASMSFFAIEGNTSSDKYDDNGGCVAIHEYSYKAVGGTNRVNGFGRPAYSAAPVGKIPDGLPNLEAWRAYCEAAYIDILYREPQPEELERELPKDHLWQVIYKMRTSVEGRRVWITVLYLLYLNRRPNEVELDTWYNALVDGRIKKGDIIRKIKKSEEYKNAHTDT